MYIYYKKKIYKSLVATLKATKNISWEENNFFLSYFLYKTPRKNELFGSSILNQNKTNETPKREITNVPRFSLTKSNKNDRFEDTCSLTI